MYFGGLLLGSVVSAGLRRRRLMVWKAFSPGYMLGAIELLCVDVAVAGWVEAWCWQDCESYHSPGVCFASAGGKLEQWVDRRTTVGNKWQNITDCWSLCKNTTTPFLCPYVILRLGLRY